MTEKEIKGILDTNQKLTKEILASIIEKIKGLGKIFSPKLTIDEVFLKNWVIPYASQLEIVIGLRFIDFEHSPSYLKLALNELENAFVYSLDFANVERINSLNQIRCNLNTIIGDVQLLIQPRFNQPNLFGLDTSAEIARLSFFEQQNNQYTYLKNVVQIVESLLEKESFVVSQELITLLLLYGLQKYPYEKKYFSYLSVLGKALDDFGNAKVIGEINTKYDERYVIIDPLTKSNLATSINDLNIAEYRKLRKRIAKMIEIEEDKSLIDHNTEITLDLRFVKNEQDQTYQWYYKVEGTNLTNTGGAYSQVEVSTAILKALFKGLKAIVDNNLQKKKIIIKSPLEDCFSNDLLDNEENKSRMKTIKSLIATQNLTIKKN